MPIPAHILAVERPKNTVVYVYGKTKTDTGSKPVSAAATGTVRTILSTVLLSAISLMESMFRFLSRKMNRLLYPRLLLTSKTGLVKNF